MKYKT